MGIEKISLHMAGADHRLINKLSGGTGQPATQVFRKAFGEPIPKLVDISQNPFLQSLFARQGVLGRIQKKLIFFSGKKGRFIPAKGTIASALAACDETQGQDLIFVGVEFLEKNHENEDLLSGILAHEWGHLVSEFPKGLDPDQLSVDQVFELRRDEEAAADGYAGRMLFLLGCRDGALAQFFLDPRNRKETAKYYDPATRAAIVREGYRQAVVRRRTAQLLAHPHAVYQSPEAVRLIAIG